MLHFLASSFEKLEGVPFVYPGGHSLAFHLLASPLAAASNPVLLRIQRLVTSGHGLFGLHFWLVFHLGTSDSESLWFGDGGVGVRSIESHLQGSEFQP